MYGVAAALSSLKPDSTVPSNSKLVEEWTYANKVCRHTLLSAFFNNLFDVFCSYKEAKDIWDSLILTYTAKDVVRQRFIIRNYYRWEMIEDKDIKTQINEYHKLLEDIKAENIILSNEFVSELLIEKLPPSWTDYKQQLKHRHKQMSLPELITNIIIEDTNRKESATARAKALTTKENMVEVRPAPKRYEHKPDHKRKNHFLKSRPNESKPTFKKKGNCFVCGKAGHHAPQCRRRERNDNPPRANIAEGDDIIVAVVSQANLMTNVSRWVVDSGATRHICANKRAFTSYTSVGDGEDHVYLGDSNTTPVLGKGKVLPKLTYGKTLVLSDVLHVPSIRVNFISVALLGNSSAYIVNSYDIWHARLGYVNSS
ncbi:uncharacterized protein LOC106760139 [Vigna radiata var. radiata]|uniref:Uncharacterized protein LOC106760139 n=1 Tax=Vigna radiata var. radiata TaxID=3916 RepID=A0A1S3TZ76_VIGRR|nr:uncharacterized protein LOC106760139 [Vigna radiata var. radiata]